ncbi:MAG: MBL fold metallo-hydrolase, partial [Ignavibacteriales bacterium]|nr:MBL fold metallo-hydrolase [Ignavibacteriales bacterium]
MKLTYYGHSAFLLQNGSTNILIDPFLDGNPLSPVQSNQINAQYIILTHGHGDHLG